MKNKTLLMIATIIMRAQISAAQETGTFTDTRDGKVYKTVKIGNQTWMSENLAFKTSSGCWAYNKDKNKVATYGYLYNWITAKKACPPGWHVATDKDWVALTRNLGGEKVAGKNMKSISGWDKNGNGTNSSGFNGLPGGSLSNPDGKSSGIGVTGVWWTATMTEDDLGMTVWSFVVSSSTDQLTKDNILHLDVDGLSVRCVKNQ